MRFNYRRRLSAASVILACVTALPTAAHAVTIQMTTVGDVGNAPDQSYFGEGPFGAVAYKYAIGIYDVTNAQYAEFLTAKAATSDPFGLYSSSMASNSQGGITRSGSGPFTYAVNAGFANKPVLFVSWYDAVRFTNWLTNGQGSGDTESGTYAITGGGVNSGTVAIPSTAQRAAWAASGSQHWMLPSEDEWYKAAYYKGGSNNAGYWLYPFQSDTIPTADMPPGGSNSANYNLSVGGLTDVGSYISAVSPYGAYDMGGDAYQWNDAIIFSSRGARGGSWNSISNPMAASLRSRSNPAVQDNHTGFRVASVPEPGSFALLIIAMSLFVCRVSARSAICWFKAA